MRHIFIILFLSAGTVVYAQSPSDREAWFQVMSDARDRDPSRDAAGANDGIIDGGYAFHTDLEDAAWWQVDLGESLALDRVVIFNRVDLWSRARSITVRLSQDGISWGDAYRHDGTPFYGFTDGKPLRVSLDGSVARYVRLQLRERSMFHLDEVQVFASREPQENIALNRFATQSTTSPHSSFKPLPRNGEFRPLPSDEAHARRIISELIEKIGPAARGWGDRLRELAESDIPVDDASWIKLYAQTTARYNKLRGGRAWAAHFRIEAMRLAIADLAASDSNCRLAAEGDISQLAACDAELPAIRAGLQEGTEEACTAAARWAGLQRRILLANPLLDFDEMLVVRRDISSASLGLPQNWQGNCSLPRHGFDNAVCRLTDFREAPVLQTLYKPRADVFVGDVDLHFDADRLLFSSLDSSDRWQIFEIGTDGTGLRQVTQGAIAETDNYDACYLPDGGVIFDSAAVCQGIPCVAGEDAVANLYRMDNDGRNVRQLCFDQDHNWNPAILADGGVLFARWEYTDTPHYFTRLLFRMNPDGTNQMAVYGSNSYWPNSMFFTRPIPGHPSKMVTIVSGHHGVARMGELVILDTARGVHEADGVVQRIPGYQQPVAPVMADRLVDDSWPKFLHPWPLSETYYLAACQPRPDVPWGIYLVDVFDNIVLIHEEQDAALLEPIPLVPRAKPPVIPSHLQLDSREATVYIADVYEGPGLAGVPRGCVDALRVFEWHYGYNKIGGHQHVAVEGGWDVKRILGTVPIESDGSAMFTVPANTPLAVQPIDKQGQALQLMRSWFSAMPGEVLSCVGCHESPNQVVPNRPTIATRRPPRALTPWYGDARGFGFKREVQPVLDRRCVGCHHASHGGDGGHALDFTDQSRGWGGFTNSYLALHPYVRRPGPESDYHMLRPAEFRANTSELIQMLEKGHHGVELAPEEWDRLFTWIDLNVPDHGTWGEHVPPARFEASYEARCRYRLQFANVAEDPEAIPPTERGPITWVKPVQTRKSQRDAASCDGWPFGFEEAMRRQMAAGAQTRRTIDLGNGVTMDMVLIPAGRFVMGDPAGEADETPCAVVTIDKPFWMGACEVTNQQFARFAPDHDSGYYDQRWKDHTTPGYPANLPDQPVVRVSWQQATAFCAWLSKQTGQPYMLPTEAQWEYAARAGTATPLSYGDLDTDFSTFANMADTSTSKLVVEGINPQPVPNPSAHADYLPKDARFDDGQRLVANVGSYKPNAWGLHDMHGNVAEWTYSRYRVYPYGGEDPTDEQTFDQRVVRGGSFRDRPKRCRSAFRLHYPDWQPVFHVGFRIVTPAVAAPGM